MIEVGEHFLTFYNVVGGKLKSRPMTAINYTRAKILGYRVVKWVDQDANKKHKPASFTIDRRLFNSLDISENW